MEVICKVTDQDLSVVLTEGETHYMIGVQQGKGKDYQQEH